MATKNPWLGLASYEEPKNDGKDHLFCGRDEETIDVVRLIDNNLFITLYGSSGIGKTSLLRAGVIPILRRKDYFPLYVRLSQEPQDIPYAEAIVRKLQDCGLEVKRSENVKTEHSDTADRLYLWEYFATTRFLNQGREVYPVIILDQFEEVFREGNKAKAEKLLGQIYLLLNDELEMPDETGWSSDTNYRFVATIREDFLFVLEDSIDENSLELYKNNRYRLRPMKPEQARQVVLTPGRDCIEDSAKEAVASRVLSLAKRPQSNDIDTLLLSLVCAGTYDKRTGEKITPDDLAVWRSNPMEVYYQDAVRGLPAKQVRYIQQHLIREDGSRRRVDEAEVKSVLGEEAYKKLTQGANRIFTVGDKEQVELLHDQLGMAVYEERKAFEEQERKKRLRRRMKLFGIITIAIAGSFGLMNYNMVEAYIKMQENQARAVAEKASLLVDDGDSYLARLLLMKLMPKNLDESGRPYVTEAEAALRKSIQHNTAILRGHTRLVYSASFSPDGKKVVSASLDNTIKIWDAQTGMELQKLEGHTNTVNSAAFSPDGKRIVSASNDKTVRIWDAQTGKKLQKLEGHTSFVNSASFSPDGKNIVSASNDKTVRIWDAQTGKELQKLEGHTNDISSASFSPDGKRIVSASWDHTIRIWDAQTGKELQKLEGHTGWGESASFSSDGTQIVSASSDETIRIWDAQTGKELQKLEGHTGSVISVSFSPDRKQIVSASSDHTVRIWDIQPEKGPQIFEGHTDIVHSASFSPDGKHIVSASGDSTVRVWDTLSGKELHKPIKHAISVNSASFSPDGKRIVSASRDDTIRIWDAQTRKLLQKSEGYTGFISSVFFSPKGKCIVSTLDNNAIRIWDAETGKELQNLEGHTNTVNSAAFSPDGKRVVSASYNNTVRIWNAQTGKELQKLEEHTDRVGFMSFSPDNRYILTALYDFTVRIWDVKSGKELLKLEGHTGLVTSASFSPDGKYIVTSSRDWTIRIWDAQTGKEVQKLESTSCVNSASFSPDGTRIVSASDDETIRIWDFPPLQQLIDETHERFKDRELTQEERRKYYLE